MERVRFGPERTGLLPLVIVLFGALPLAASSPALLWLLLLPLVAAVWVLRARVVADADGLTVCNGLRRTRYPWARVAGFDVPRRGPVRLLLDTGSRRTLTALPRRQLRSLVAVAPGGPAEPPTGPAPAPTT